MAPCTRGASVAANVAALLFVVASTQTFANPNCFVEGTDNWKRCAATCRKACQDTRLDFKTVRAFCEPLARLDKTALNDDPSCAAILKVASPTQSVQTCIATATSRPGLADLLKNEQLPAAFRDALSKRLADPPRCAPNPAAIKTMSDCLEAEIDKIGTASDELKSRVASSSSCRPLAEYGQIFQTLDSSKTHARNVEELMKEKLFTCTVEWKNWLEKRAGRSGQQAGGQDDSSAQNSGSSLTFTQALNSIVEKLKANLDEATAKQTKLVQTMDHMNESLDAVQADAAKVMLDCNN